MTINLHHIDCMEFMASLPDKYYDLAIVLICYFVILTVSITK